MVHSLRGSADSRARGRCCLRPRRPERLGVRAGDSGHLATPPLQAARMQRIVRAPRCASSRPATSRPRPQRAPSSGRLPVAGAVERPSGCVRCRSSAGPPCSWRPACRGRLWAAGRGSCRRATKRMVQRPDIGPGAIDHRGPWVRLPPPPRAGNCAVTVAEPGVFAADRKADHRSPDRRRHRPARQVSAFGQVVEDIDEAGRPAPAPPPPKRQSPSTWRIAPFRAAPDHPGAPLPWPIADCMVLHHDEGVAQVAAFEIRQVRGRQKIVGLAPAL